jgi:hypothetical protein
MTLEKEDEATTSYDWGTHNYGTSPFIVDLPMKNGDFP